MTIKNWPNVDRPREKLLLKGANALSDAELLAIFIHTGVKGKSAVEIARTSLDHFGSIRALLNSPINQFCEIPGLSRGKYANLQAALEMGKRYMQEQLKRQDVLSNALDTKRYLSVKMRDYQQEVFAGLFLDNKNRIIVFEELFRGTINNAAIYPREIVKRVLFHNAANVIFAHNHPSGIATPSEADKLITVQLKKALALINVRVLDHFIIGDSDIRSLSEFGVV